MDLHASITGILNFVVGRVGKGGGGGYYYILPINAIPLLLKVCLISDTCFRGDLQ